MDAGILALTHCYGVVLVTNKTPPRVSAAVGSPTVLQCDGTTSSGGRAPTFSWRKDNVPLGSSFRGTITTSAGSTSSQATSVLSIPNVSAAHRGWYTCFAQDSSSDGSKDFYIDVQGVYSGYCAYTCKMRPVLPVSERLGTEGYLDSRHFPDSLKSSIEAHSTSGTDFSSA